MGMRAHYVQLDSEDMDQILANKKAASEVLMGASLGGMDMKTVFDTLGVKDSDLKAMEKMLGPLPSFMKGGPQSATMQKKRPNLAIEKSWQAIHFVLNGDPWKGSGLLNNAVLGGQEVGEDMGYGKARYLDPFKVVQTSTALDKISDEEFKRKAQAADFRGKQIYVYGDQLSKEDLEELCYFFKQIQQFFRTASDKSKGILLGII
jgi:hypothetical protein